MHQVSPGQDVNLVSIMIKATNNFQHIIYFIKKNYNHLECTNGRYGVNCENTCTCSENTYCDTVTGACICRPGYRGLTCQIGMVITRLSFRQLIRCISAISPGCTSGRYGKDCEKTCQCQNGGTCDPVHGSCTCQPGFIGAHCEEGNIFLIHV